MSGGRKRGVESGWQVEEEEEAGRRRRPGGGGGREEEANRIRLQEESYFNDLIELLVTCSRGYLSGSGKRGTNEGMDETCIKTLF